MEEIFYNREQQSQNWELYDLNWEDFELIIYIQSQILDGIASGLNKRNAIKNAYNKLTDEEKERFIKISINIFGKNIEDKKKINKNIRLKIEEIELNLKDNIFVKITI